jgi:RNA polymerase sigma factor (sigma-70 family)
VEVSALTHASTAPGLRGPSPLLRLQSDERLIGLTRRGQHAAFETLCSRYQSRLLSFVRHMLGSREDAEDVLQEVFAAAFNAVLADEREINVRPWLYRIARNRSLNHLRRASAVGMDSMDVHFADHGLSTGDRVLRRESFRELLADVRQLPETQRTALLLREIDALSYEQIAHTMETTVPSVKSLLVRARISLAEAAEARKLSCAEVRLELGEVAEGLVRLSPPARRHVRACDRCRSFKRQLKENNHALAAILPVGPLLLVKQLLLAKLGSTASAGSAHVASGAGVTMGAGAAAGAGAAGGAGAGGVFTVGAGALATKAVAGLAAAAIVSAGAVAANQTGTHQHRAAHMKTAYMPAQRDPYEPVLASQRAQPLSLSMSKPAAIASHGIRHHRGGAAKLTPAAGTAPAPLPAGTAPAAVVVPTPTRPAERQAPATQLTQLTTETTQLPPSATGAPQPGPATAIDSPEATAPSQASATAEAPPTPAPETASSPPDTASVGPDTASSAPETASVGPDTASVGPETASWAPAATTLVSSQAAAASVAPPSSAAKPSASPRTTAARLRPSARRQPAATRDPTAGAKSTSASPSRRRPRRSAL